MFMQTIIAITENYEIMNEKYVFGKKYPKEKP